MVYFAVFVYYICLDLIFDFHLKIKFNKWVEYFQIFLGSWLLNPSYIEESLKAGVFLNEKDFELKDFNEIAKYCRKNKGIFNGIKYYVETNKNTKYFKRWVIGHS